MIKTKNGTEVLVGAQFRSGGLTFLGCVLKSPEGQKIEDQYLTWYIWGECSSYGLDEKTKEGLALDTGLTKEEVTINIHNEVWRNSLKNCRPK